MTRLTQHQRSSIVALHQAKMSFNEISKSLSISKTSCVRWWQNYQKRGNVADGRKSGRPKKMSSRKDRRVARLAMQNRRISASDLTAAFNVGLPINETVCTKTIRRSLHRSNIRGRIAARKLNLSTQTMKLRMSWCRIHRYWTVTQWRQVVFTDECRVGFNSDGCISVWRRSGERGHPDCITTRGTSRKSVMFWGAVTATGTLPLVLCSERMDSNSYISTLESAAIQALPEFNLIFMDDNAPVHRAARVCEWKSDWGLRCLPWPAYSPDLNIIENLWALVKKRLQQLSQKPATLDDLAGSFQEIWNAIPQSTISSLYHSLPNRLCLCLKSNGSPICY